jgi:hypothetical protein
MKSPTGGNGMYKNRYFTKSTGCWTASRSTPLDPVLLTNRCQCHSWVKQWPMPSRLQFSSSLNMGLKVLPYFCPPICIAHVPSHFVALEMFNPLYFPAPQLLYDWKEDALPEALPWENKFLLVTFWLLDTKFYSQRLLITKFIPLLLQFFFHCSLMSPPLLFCITFLAYVPTLDSPPSPSLAVPLFCLCFLGGW